MATFVEKSLGGAGFFEAVRATMATTGDWLFAGTDTFYSLKYVVMDALFYGMETILRPDGSANADYNPSHLSAQTFTGSAAKLTNSSLTVPRFRVVVNGNFYDNTAYNVTPGANHWWQGELYKGGKPIQAPPKSANAAPLCDCSFIGRNGQRTGCYRCENFKPSLFNSQHPSSKLTYALGGLLRLIQNKKQAPSLDTTEWFVKGKTIVGLHKTTETVFVVVQEDANLLGTELAKIVARLTDAGVNDAVKCDSGSSATLIVDGAIVIKCVERKDNSTPNGLAFKFANLTLGGPNSDLSVNGGPQSIPNFDGSIAATAGKLTLTINSFGSTQLKTPGAVASSLSLPANAGFPLKLEAVAPKIDFVSATGVTFKSTAFGTPLTTVQCVAKLKQQPDVDAITGAVSVIQSGTPVGSGNFSWPILV
jgi:Phosphodiester glycosidase